MYVHAISCVSLCTTFANAARGNNCVNTEYGWRSPEPTHNCNRTELLIVVNSMCNISAVAAIVDRLANICSCKGSPVKSHNVSIALVLVNINSGYFVCCIEIGLEVIDSNTHNAYSSYVHKPDCKHCLVGINSAEFLSTGTRSQPCRIVGSNPLNVHCLFHDDRVGVIYSHISQANYAKPVSQVRTSCLLDIEHRKGPILPTLH